jgi:hypothetical protein
LEKERVLREWGESREGVRTKKGLRRVRDRRGFKIIPLLGILPTTDSFPTFSPDWTSSQSQPHAGVRRRIVAMTPQSRQAVTSMTYAWYYCEAQRMVKEQDLPWDTGYAVASAKL